MREILFRGKAINRDYGYHRINYKNGDWVYGLVTRLYDERFENLPAEMTNVNGIEGIEVDYKTIGQYTGLTDMNGNKIFEGDIHKFSDFFVVQFGMYIDCDTDIQGYGFYLRKLKTNYCYSFDATENAYINIVGNIHDNPELLKEGDGE